MFAETRKRVAAAALVMAAAAPAHALEQRPLPAFSVMTPAGEQVASASLAGEPRVLLIFVSEPCGPCGPLWIAMEQWNVEALPGRTVVVVAGTPERAAEVAATMPEGLGAVRVFADPDGSARQAMRLTNALTIVGLDRGRVRWGLAGVLNDPKALRSTLTSWLTQEATSAATP